MLHHHHQLGIRFKVTHHGQRRFGPGQIQLRYGFREADGHENNQQDTQERACGFGFHLDSPPNRGSGRLRAGNSQCVLFTGYRNMLFPFICIVAGNARIFNEKNAAVAMKKRRGSPDRTAAVRRNPSAQGDHIIQTQYTLEGGNRSMLFSVLCLYPCLCPSCCGRSGKRV